MIPAVDTRDRDLSLVVGQVVGTTKSFGIALAGPTVRKVTAASSLMRLPRGVLLHLAAVLIPTGSTQALAHHSAKLVMVFR